MTFLPFLAAHCSRIVFPVMVQWFRKMDQTIGIEYNLGHQVDVFVHTEFGYKYFVVGIDGATETFRYCIAVGCIIEDVFYELMDDYVYRGYLSEGYSSLAPYYASDAIINPYRVVDFTEISLFDVPNDVKTADRRQIIFELYYKKYEKSMSCSL